MKQQEGEGFSSKKDFESLLLLFLFYLNDMCFRLKSCCHFLKLRNHFLYALLSYGCALTTNNSPVLQLCVTICCASLSLVCILNFTHLGANFTEKRICMHFLCSKFPRIRKKQLGGRKETKIWARFSTPSPPPVNRAKEKHLSWKMWREREALLSVSCELYLSSATKSAIKETRARLCFNHEAEYSCVYLPGGVIVSSRAAGITFACLFSRE